MHVAMATPGRRTALTVATLRVKFSNQMEEQSANNTEDPGIMQQKTQDRL